MSEVSSSDALTCWPATAKRWSDLATLFGEQGACGGCWCMWWRKSRSHFGHDKGTVNRDDLHRLVRGDQPPGLLGYLNQEPVAWVALAPRSTYPVAARSRIMSLPPDIPNQEPHSETDIWLISCLFVRRDQRRRGIATTMLKHAVAHATTSGAWALDGVPVEPKSTHVPDAFAWTGLPACFQAAGFVEIARPGQHRPLLRYQIGVANPVTRNDRN